MSKKMHDILPPKLAHKVEDTIKALGMDGKRKSVRSTSRKNTGVKNQRREIKQREAENKKAPRFPLKEIFVGGGIILVLLGIYVITKLPKADIQIWPTTETLTLSEKVTADKSVQTVDVSNKFIPAQYIEFQKDGSQEFPATGSASNDGKATGTITIFNKISPSTPFTLIKGTHFLSDSGKYFVTTQKVTIPASVKKVPGSIKVQVVAEQFGADYNIGPSNFSIPKLNGTTYYYNVYASSTTAMEGGYTGKVKKVTDDDIKTAKEVLTKQLLIQAEASLRSKLGPDDVLLDGAMVKNVVSDRSSVKSGTIADTFSESAAVKVSALVFKKKDLENFVKSKILSELPSSKNFLENTLQMTYDPGAIDMQLGKEAIDVKVSVKTYESIDTISLVDLFSMKSSDQIKQAVDQMYGGKIAELKINFWPFWVSKAPSDKDRIKVNLKFE